MIADTSNLLLTELTLDMAIYDDRLEVSSPGGLYNGLTFEDALHGRSKLRNRTIANIFSQMGLIEAWGTGLQRIRNAANVYGLQEPEFIEMEDGFRVNLYRQATSLSNSNPVLVANVGENIANVGENIANVGENIANVGENIANVGENVGDIKTMIMRIITDNNRISASEIAKMLSVTQRTVERNIKDLRESGKIMRHGGARGGYWEYN